MLVLLLLASLRHSLQVSPPTFRVVPAQPTKSHILQTIPHCIATVAVAASQLVRICSSSATLPSSCSHCAASDNSSLSSNTQHDVLLSRCDKFRFFTISFVKATNEDCWWIICKRVPVLHLLSLSSSIPKLHRHRSFSGSVGYPLSFKVYLRKIHASFQIWHTDNSSICRSWLPFSVF